MPLDVSRDALPPAPRWHHLPAWLLSLAAHLMIAILGVVLLRLDRPERSAEPDRLATIVLTHRTAASTEYFSQLPSASSQRHEVMRPATDTAEAGGGIDPAALPPPEPPVLEGITLPSPAKGFAPGAGLVAAPRPGAASGRGPLFPGIDDAAILAEDAKIPREVLPTGPTAQLSLFGAAAEGRSFVFVIDRSKSMGSEGLGVIRAAAAELQTQLSALTDEQTLQVVAYNQLPAFLDKRELLPATEANKSRLVEFVARLAAFGQTEHHHALLAALRLKPEVIFLLTDGGDPVLHDGQLRTIRELAAGRTAIHCLQFGRGPLMGESFLAHLAAENGGQYVYIDVTAR